MSGDGGFMVSTFSNIVSVPELASLLRGPGLVVVDCRFDLTDPAAGLAAYAAGHIPGAVFADLDRDLSGPISALSGGRHPLPDPEQLCARLGAWGIRPKSQVVAYDAASGMLAGRLWWLLRWLGHRRVAVLDGGWPAWVQAGQPVTQQPPASTPARFAGRPGQMPVTDADWLAASLASGQSLLVDVRAPERFRGEVEPLDHRAGRVPGAVNLPLAMNLDERGRFLPAPELGALYRGLLAGRSPDQLVVMCGSGVSACHALVAMDRAGLAGATLYAGSWSDWISDSSRPVASG